MFGRILQAKRHPEQGYRSCLGILRLGEQYPKPRVEAAARHGDAVPAGQQANEGGLFGGDHLAAQAGEGFAADLLEHVGVAPFAMDALGAELAFEQFSRGMQVAEDGFDLG